MRPLCKDTGVIELGSGYGGTPVISSASERVAREFIEQYNRGTPDWVESCHAEDSVWIEHAIAGVTTGRGGDRSVVREAAESALEQFPDRRMEIVNLVASDDQVALEVVWSGTPAMPFPGIPAGGQFRLRLAMFLTIEGGRIRRQVDYPCIDVP